MNSDASPLRLGIPVYAQRKYVSNVLLLASSSEEAVRLLQRLRADAHPDQVSDLTVDDVTFDEPVYYFDLERPHITVSDFELQCSIFGLGGADHPALPATIKRCHLFIATGDPQRLHAVLRADQLDQVFSVGSHSIEDVLEEVLVYVLDHASLTDQGT